MCVRNSLCSVILIYLVALLGLAFVVLAQNEGNISQSAVAVGEECGSTQKMVDECFKDLPPHLMEFLQNTKIVISKKEITQKCK